MLNIVCGGPRNGWLNISYTYTWILQVQSQIEKGVNNK